MSDTERLPEDVFDALVEGRTPSAAAGSPVARFLRSLRDDATPSAAPTPELSAVLSEGIDPKELEAGGILTAETDQGILTRGILTAETDHGILTRGILTFSGNRAASPKGILTRSRLATRAAFTNVAAFGILTKAAAAGAAVTVATAGAGTANVLPSGAQMAFDDIVGREPVVEVEEEVEDPIGETGIVVETDDNEANDFGERVSGDATGETDGEKGVDGREIACERADEDSQACEDEDEDGDEQSRGRGLGLDKDDADRDDDADDTAEEAEEEQEAAEDESDAEDAQDDDQDEDDVDEDDESDDAAEFKSTGNGADRSGVRGNRSDD